MRQVLLGLGALVLICAAGYVMAQATAQQVPAQEEDRGTQLRLSRMDTSMAAFRKLDKDSDGRISALEAADNPKVAAAFTLADKDKDGYLSPEEFASISSTGAHPDVDASSPSGDQPAKAPEESPPPR